MGEKWREIKSPRISWTLFFYCWKFLDQFLTFFSTRVLETHLGGLKAACIGPALSQFRQSVGDGTTYFHNILLIFPHKQEAGPPWACDFLFSGQPISTQERKILASFKRVLQGDSSTCQLLEAVLLADSILLHISQDLAGITNFLMEVLQQLLGHFCSLAWQE